MLVLTIQPGTTSCLAASKLDCTICLQIADILKHSCFQVIASALAYPNMKVSVGCRAGFARCSQAGTQNWTIATQLTHQIEQEHPERTSSLVL